MALALIIADDHALFRQGLRSLLLLQPNITVAAEVDSTTKLNEALERSPCDVLLLDLQMDHWTMNDIPALAQRTLVIVLTASEMLLPSRSKIRAHGLRPARPRLFAAWQLACVTPRSLSNCHSVKIQ
jgi:DNA-binding NarL/FixJ family response regulator